MRRVFLTSSVVGILAEDQCRYPNSEIGWTGKETHALEATWQICRTKCFEAQGCCGWVFLGNNDCYQKYDTGSGCPLQIGVPDRNYGSSAGLVQVEKEDYHANSEIGWTGKETHTSEATWQICRTKCSEAEGCCGWVFLGNSECYQKYDTGSGCPLQIGVPDRNYGSSAGLMPDYHANSNIGWTGKETHAKEATWQTCRTKCVEAEGCCGWVFLGNNDCYQKYNTGSGCPLKIGVPDRNYGSSAGHVDQQCDASMDTEQLAQSGTDSKIPATWLLPAIGGFGAGLAIVGAIHRWV